LWAGFSFLPIPAFLSSRRSAPLKLKPMELLSAEEVRKLQVRRSSLNSEKVEETPSVALVNKSKEFEDASYLQGVAALTTALSRSLNISCLG
jgi:hypothetical protein